MKTKYIFFYCFFWVLISCSKNTVFEQFDRLGDNNQWAKEAIKTYDFSIDDDSKMYAVIFQFSHVYDYQFASFPVNFSIEKPDGSKEDFTADIVIRDNLGKELGDCSGDICDLNTVVKANMKLQKGQYKISVAHQFDGPYLPNVFGVGLEIVKAE